MTSEELFLQVKSLDPAGVPPLITRYSPNISDKDVKRLLPATLKQLQQQNAFEVDHHPVSADESLNLIESVMYMQLLAEEHKLKSGRKGFFLANFKSVKPEWVYLCFEILIGKSLQNSPRDLIALYIGKKNYDLGILSSLTETEKFKAFIELTRKSMVGIFQDAQFIGFASYQKINDVESFIQIMFDEITGMNDYFKKQGSYYELYGEIKGITALPVKPVPKQQIPEIKKVTLSPLQKNLAVLSLKELPATKSELKKIFFKFAAATHPDKFEHVEKGTRTELAIVGKFREVYAAYEFLEQEIEKKISTPT